MLEALFAFDEALRAWIVSHHTPALDVLMAAASAAGRRSAIWLAFGLVAATLRPAWRMPLCQMILAIVLAYLATDAILKPLVARDRPFVAAADARVIDLRPDDYSFPSGHAASSFAAAFVLARLWRRARAAIWTLAALIACSRVYVGVHYPLDVAGGALVGMACAAFAAGGTRWRTAGSRYLAI